MIKIEKIINEHVPVNNAFTCFSCATNNNKVTYIIHITNKYMHDKFLLCSDCIKQLGLNIEHLKAQDALEEATE